MIYKAYDGRGERYLQIDARWMDGILGFVRRTMTVIPAQDLEAAERAGPREFGELG